MGGWTWCSYFKPHVKWQIYLVMKVKLSKKWKGVMACDVSPVAMFCLDRLASLEEPFVPDLFLNGFSNYIICPVSLAWKSLHFVRHLIHIQSAIRTTIKSDICSDMWSDIWSDVLNFQSQKSCLSMFDVPSQRIYILILAKKFLRRHSFSDSRRCPSLRISSHNLLW